MTTDLLTHISFNTIFCVWRFNLWPDRHSTIEQTSAMNYLGGNDLRNMKYNPTFFGYYINDKLIGVNSGHMTMDNKYRSRGLYVFPEHRGKGIGIELLLATIKQGKTEDAKLCWSFPRQESVNTYLSAGFTLSSDFTTSETGINAYCIKKYF